VIRSNAKQAAFSNGKPRNIPTGGGGPDKDYIEDDKEFTTDDPFVDRVMNLLGWHLAFGVGIDDELESNIVSIKMVIHFTNGMCKQSIYRTHHCF